ncbi:MAG: hypothetical protein GTO55_11365, partial [Armatimonadetes bacterium]|nr:hypothetical protein [Armatimonadota bacterium]NIM24815.1 hypothetical protein [Armatimonadota bacterium]NIM68706.1 hypothetical protein [Armatimonadota bacterium]NIM77001.1 hypothetical protein [Armatimonadota bacterium]NIN06906.1 hypothetical protein [Armatimonadota bacterium]
MALSLAQVQYIFGRFSFRALSSGLIAPQPAWLARNIVLARAPFPLPTPTGRTETIRCHRLVLQHMLSALGELNHRGLCRLIRSFDGCYVPRHVRWDTNRPLSRHAWGIALDLNAAQFPFGSPRKQDSRLVEVFAKHGFLCGQEDGGLWRNTLDPM